MSTSPPPTEKPYAYYEQQLITKVHHYYISSAVEEPHKYTDLIHNLHSSTTNETIYIHLNTPGGNLATGVQIINAIRNSQAHVVVSVESEVQSLGTFIFLAADEWIVHDNCFMMFHNYSGKIIGKGHEQRAAIDSTDKWVRELAENLYSPFLSEDEIKRVTNGEDLYFHSKEIRTRLNKMVKFLKKQTKQKNQTINS